ncbi:putative aldehyde oxidase gad-3 [Dirofilaria immitis]
MLTSVLIEKCGDVKNNLYVEIWEICKKYCKMSEMDVLISGSRKIKWVVKSKALEWVNFAPVGQCISSVTSISNDSLVSPSIASPHFGSATVFNTIAE